MRRDARMVGFFDSNCVIGLRSVRRSGVAGEAEFYSLETCGSGVVYGMVEKFVR